MSLKHMEIFEKLISNMYIGVAVHKMIFDEQGNPVNYRFIDVNPTFLRITGLSREQIINRTIKEVVPDLEEEWIHNYGEVVKSGVEMYFELYTKAIDRCFKVHAYSYEGDKFVSLMIDATEEYMLQEHLKEEVIRNNIAAKSAKIAFFKYDLTTNRQTVMDYWYELVGASERAEDVQSYFISHVHPEDKYKIVYNLEQLEKNCECQYEFRFFNEASSKYIWLRKTVTLLPQDKDQSIRIAIGIYQDINQEKLAQEEIEKLAQMLDLGIKNGCIDVWDYDVSLDQISFRSYNSEVDLTGEKHHKFSLNEHISKINKEDLYGFLQELSKIQKHRQSTLNVKYRVFSERRNKEIWMKSTGKAIDFDEEGNVLRAVGISEDITKRVEDEQKMMIDQKRLKQAQQIAHLGGWEYYFRDDILVLSEEALQLLGIVSEKNKFTLEEFGAIIGEDQADKLKRFRIGISRTYQYEEEFFMHLASETKKIHVIAAKSYDAKGKLINVIGTFQDITERNALEERLRQAEKMTAVGQLAGGIAHDFNNILMAASGYTELIKYKTKDTMILDYCNKILYSVMSSADLTKKLLAFSRKDSLFKSNIHVHECICKALEILSITIDRNISFDLNFSAETDIIYADEAELQNVFINLCLNSRDAMPEGGHIRLVTELINITQEDNRIEEFVMNAGTYIKIQVIDNGSGMSKDIIKSIFEPFFTTKEIGKGTGLGLSATYGTIVSHNGAITVQSTLGQGTCFSIFLPLIND